MAAASGSDLPGQPPPYSVADDVALLGSGGDDIELSEGRRKIQPALTNVQPQQPYGFTYSPPSGHFGQPLPANYLSPLNHLQQQQQTTTVVVTGQTQQPTVIYVPSESFCCKMVFACCVLWCCNPVFGLIAFILAAHADNIKVVDREGAYRLGRASVWVSVIGMIIGIVAIAVIVAMAVNQRAQYIH